MPRTHLLIDNDFGGDPDGLVQLAHHLLSPSANIVGVINSHVMPNDPNWPTNGDSIQKGIEDLTRIYELTNRQLPTFPGLRESEIEHSLLVADDTLDFLVSTVEDSSSELIYSCGGPMTQLARLIKAKPKNLENLKVLWIGGSEYAGAGSFPPGGTTMEYNLAADLESVQIVFANPQINLWHIPRDSYRRCVVSFAELEARLKGKNTLSDHLYKELDAVKTRALGNGIDIGETYCLGDSALVLLSVLENSFEPTPAGSEFTNHPRHEIGPNGQYLGQLEIPKEKTRVFSSLDTRLMFEDMFLKFALAN